MLIDSATIFVRSGKGGDGSASFRREKYIAKGGPDGGDGGKGGDVILQATAGVDTLLDLTGRHHWHAEDGDNGTGRGSTGRSGDDLLIKLPPGSLVYNDDTGELLVDLDEPGKSVVIAKGGKPGLGNQHFKSSTNQAPTQFTFGGPAVELNLRIELKMMADVGLVGLPNAGKSTLLSSITRAHPKIANYPFTTLEPNLGIVELKDYRRFVVADIPGLIEGASEGHGLGYQFLRHVERTRLLIHLLEIEPADGSDPIENYNTIRSELTRYSPVLAEKPQIVALSKVDLLGGIEDQAVACQLIEQRIGVPVHPISSASREGLDELLDICWNMLQKIPRPAPIDVLNAPAAPTDATTADNAAADEPA